MKTNKTRKFRNKLFVILIALAVLFTSAFSVMAADTSSDQTNKSNTIVQTEKEQKSDQKADKEPGDGTKASAVTKTEKKNALVNESATGVSAKIDTENKENTDTSKKEESENDHAVKSEAAQTQPKKETASQTADEKMEDVSIPSETTEKEKTTKTLEATENEEPVKPFEDTEKEETTKSFEETAIPAADVSTPAKESKGNASVEKETTTVQKTEKKKTQKDSDVLYLNAADLENSTTLADGEYTEDDFSYTFEGGTGKAKLTLEKIVVENGKAMGVFTASSANMTHVYYLGHTGSENDDNTYYNPTTDKCGQGVLPIQNKSVEFPIVLNKKTELACRTTAMTAPHWVQYYYTITIEETPAETGIDNSTTLADGDYTISDSDFSWTGGTGKANLSIDKVIVKNGRATGVFTASSANMTHVYYLGHTASENEDTAYYNPSTDKCGEGVLPITNKSVQFPVVLNKTQDVACRTVAMTSPHWVQYQYKITLDEGASKPAEKQKYTITIKPVDEKTGKEVSKATVTVKDSKGSAIKVDSANVYTLTEGSKYTISAVADGYEETIQFNYKPTQNETLKIELTPEEVLPEGTIIFQENTKDSKKTNLFNTTGMFKVIKGVLVNTNGKRTLTVTLSGSGYHYLYKGTYEEALANGLNKKNWIAGKQNKQGKWEFVIPLDKKDTFIPIVAISDSHLQKVEKGQEKLSDAIFARQIVLDVKKNTLTAGDYDQVVEIKVVSKTDAFKVKNTDSMEVIGGPNSNNYSCIPVVTMQDNRFSTAFIGTAKDAAKKGASTIKRKNNSFTFTFANTFGESGLVKTFEDKKPIAVAFYDTTLKKWVDYKLTINKEKSTVTIEALKADEAPPEAPKPGEKYEDSSSVQTGAVDNSTTLKDGTYSAKNFRFSGGTGKVVITCQKIEVKGGQAYATIVFGKPDGRAASIDGLRANGQEYSGFNTFTIPVELNKNNTIVARTTAMSQPHWVEYTIFIVLDEPGKESSGTDVSEKTSDLDEKAPDIIGLTASGEVEVTYSDLVKIFNYEDGYYLIEVDAVKDTARDTLGYRTQMAVQAIAEAAAEKAAKNKKDEEQAAVFDDVEEGEGTVAESISEMIAKLYKNEIVKYLVIPDGKEIPAGLDKEVLIIKQPADKTYVSSKDALEQLDKLGLTDNITALGLEEADVKDTAVKEAGQSSALAFGGTYDDWDLKAMIRSKTNLAIESARILPQNESDIEKDMANLVRLGERAAQLNMAMFIDRSEDEDSALAKAEWLKVYGVIYNAKEQAEQAYKEIVNAASEKDKQDVEKQIKTRAEEKAKMKKDAEAAAKKQTGEDN